MTTDTNRRDRIRRLEEIGFVTWPAFERSRYDGWELRAAGRVTRRANSVNPMKPSTLPLATKIEHCERWFTDRNQPAVFRLTELAEPELDDMLATRGYERNDTTIVMTAGIGAGSKLPPQVSIDRMIKDEWFVAFCSWNGHDPALAGSLHRLLESIPGATAYASITVDNQMAAVGLGVVADGHLGIYNMNTDPRHRRGGMAARVLSALRHFGAELGAVTSFLQVVEANAPASSLYANAGFAPLYPYWYRERPK